MKVDIKNLFENYKDTIYRICYRYTKSEESADDLVQEIFIKAFKSKQTFRQESQVFTWIYRIAVNCCLDYLRLSKNRESACTEYIDDLVCENIGAQNSDARLTLEKVLEKVNPKTREVLFLYHAEGLTHNEIASIMGVSRVAITRRLNGFNVNVLLGMIIVFWVSFIFFNKMQIVCYNFSF